ncbi:MAG: hypothetical protein OEZ58_11065 [Gammaproteobacteria bacterium]|nr:hypothetical protein [Gammaproteobacteria bacterium]MDH5729523.1 hypothetical protein [Gammaproteobacteria bacterium]
MHIIYFLIVITSAGVGYASYDYSINGAKARFIAPPTSTSTYYNGIFGITNSWVQDGYRKHHR